MQSIICHGDSLTEGSDIEPAYRWPALLGNALGVEVINTGIGGDTTAGLLSRFSTDVIVRKPRAVILMGGTNDFWWDLPVNLALANLATMAYQAQYHGIAPLLGLPLPFDEERAAAQPYSPPAAGYGKLREKLNSLASLLKKTAAEKEVPILDFQQLYLDDKGQVCSQYLLEDGVHPNREGHRKMAKLTASVLTDIFMF